MQQYYTIKAKHPDALLLFRVGDFYETFGEDAIKTAEILGITLTRRANGSASFVELAGFPFHALDTYLHKLVRAGQRVAICEQLEDPKLTKKIVKRGVTELITPGVSLNDNVLENRENNYLACVHLESTQAGVAFLDISTGEFYTAQGSIDYIDKLLGNFQPKEVLFERSHSKEFVEYFGNKYYTYKLDEWIFNQSNAESKLLKHFQTQSLKGFGIQDIKLGIVASGAILQYLEITEHHQLGHIVSISRIEEDRFVWLDKFTMRNLELFQGLNEGSKTLLDVIDRTITPMGSRMLRRWLALPLKEVHPINERLDIVQYFIDNDDIKCQIEDYIRNVGDLERLTSKIATGRVSPREVMQIKNALRAIEPIKEVFLYTKLQPLNKIGEQLNPCKIIADKIENELFNEPPTQIGKGQVFKNAVDQELDELRQIMTSGKDFLLEIQQRESDRTGIPSLKVNFNNVFGYFIEVRNTHKDKVPTDWIRKQTLVSAERYITQELKIYEEKILGAEEKVLAIEARLFNELVSSLCDYIAALQLNASLISKTDCLIGLSTVAIANNYTRPDINDSEVLEIKDGRHPVIEKRLTPDNPYISNDTLLDNKDQQVIIITGPNMSGKSALLRQTALIMIMAQMGSFVPVSSAKLGIVDKIFTRVGASDNISSGESTFMVEMLEAASILNNLSNRSLVLLDEIGRGTSTYDGISIAWAMVEFIHEHPTAKAKTLFATHYHELNEMEASFQRIKNYNVSIKEVDKKVLFLRKLVRGGSAHSFGIHVARMAGMPKSVVVRANEILSELEGKNNKHNLNKPSVETGQKREGYQLSFFQLEDPVLKRIRDEMKNLDINNLTPIDALNKLNEIKRISGL